jgi:Family of unknown function (DUF5947)
MKVDRPEFETPFGTLRQFIRRKRTTEVCELCSQELGPEHAHLLELAKHKLLCSCEGCALLFSSQSNARYKRVPRRIQLLRDFQMSDAEWEGLLIPINMAFFFKSSVHSTVTALYPSPAGATESLLTLDSWSDIVGNNPALNEMESDVEALLVNRVAHAHGAGPDEYYLLPIDECYRLVGIIRRHWRGLSGGTELWQEIAKFFDQLKARATVVPRESYA